MDADTLTRLIAVAEAEGIRVISDEIYHGLDYAFSAETAASVSDQAVVINSFSKYFCMTGWRVGWMIVPDVLVRSVECLQGNLAISVPTLAQVAAEAAFDGRDEMEAVKHGYEENRRILTDDLPKAGLDKFLPVDGAFYLYADVSSFSNDSLDFAKRMMRHIFWFWRRVRSKGAFGSSRWLLAFGDGFDRRVSVLARRTFGGLMLLRLRRKFGLGRLLLTSVVGRLGGLVLRRFPKPGIGSWTLCRLDRGFCRGDRLALHDIAVPMSFGTAVTMATAASSCAIIGFGVGVTLVAFFLGDQRLPVGDRDLVVVRMNFGESEKAVAIAAVIHKGGLQRWLNARNLGEIDVTAKLLAVGAFEVEFLDAIAA